MKFFSILKINDYRETFHERQFLLERMTDRQTVVIQAWVFADIFSKMNKVSLSLQGKQLTVFIANDQIQTFKQKLGFWKACIHRIDRHN